ncbi:MAG: valine--pyruvate transaminase [Lentisphaeraceae bacterium]|nr:valine--pyruvate transaminase [Lentisphaeraceae bacterium]
MNMFAGTCSDGRKQKILLPLTPEYIGYSDLGLDDDIFASYKPRIDLVDDHTFKYGVDFDALEIGDDVGAMCVSRPTNPTGNVLTDDEMEKLDLLAKKHNIPLIIDNAYGVPFPDIIFADATPLWNENVILCSSLSKLGLPGVRTGIVIAREEIVSAISNINSIVSLAPGSIGAAITSKMVEDGDIIKISREIIKPYYQGKAIKAIEWVHREFAGLDYYVHKAEGAMFLWLWFKDLPISSYELYERLKKRNVLIVSGHFFFPGIEDDWQHSHECIRMTYSMDAEVVEEALKIIADEVKSLYK